MSRDSQRKFPRLDLDATARNLSELLLASRPGELQASDDPVDVAIEQVTGGVEQVGDRVIAGVQHPQPCRKRGCRPCGYARAILILQQHRAQTKSIPTGTETLVQRGADLRDLAGTMGTTERGLGVLEELLAKHVEVWERLDDALERLGWRSHDHDSMCVRPRAALETTRRLREILSGLPEALVQPLRPEVRAMGQKPPDTLFVDFARELLFAELTRAEIVDLIAEDAVDGAPKDPEYWLDKVSRAQRKLEADEAPEHSS